LIYPLSFLISMRLFKKSNLADHFRYPTVFLLLSCLLIDPMTGAFTWLHYKKAVIKKEVKKHIIDGIEKDELVLLKFSKKETETELLWSHPREFEYNHKMYDIVKTKTEGDTVYYWCWYDHEETMLKREMEKVADQALGKKQKIREEIALLISFSKTLYFPFSFNSDVIILDFLCNQVDLFYDLYSQIFVKPPTPPPQLS
jgi:hypothetical protein